VLVLAIVVTALQHKPLYTTSLSRGGGDALKLAVSSPHDFHSYGFTLSRRGYAVTSAVLSAYDGSATNYRAGQGPCAPASGVAGVVCHSFPYMTGTKTGVRSVTITFTTRPCYPAGAGLSGGVSGPTGACADANIIKR
jgi:hypothetical protein